MKKWLLVPMLAALALPAQAQYTREQLRDFATSLAVELADPLPPPLTNMRTVDVYVHDVVMKNGERLARVPVTLQEPAKQTVYFRVTTVNDTALENNHFVRYDKWLMFQPGEQSKIVEITLKADFPGKRFKLRASSPLGFDGTSIPQLARDIGYIYGEGGVPLAPTPKVEAVTVALPPKPTGLNIVFEEDFSNFKANDTGMLADGTKVWRQKLGHGYYQSNGELGWNATDTKNPGTMPWLIEDGKFNLQVQHWPDGVPGADTTAAGAPIWFYSAAIISSKYLFDTIGVGSYVEARMTIPQKTGIWPAFWLLYKGSNMVNSSSYAPQPEIDIFEGFYNGGVGLAKTGTTVHWRTSTNGHGQMGNRLDPLGPIDLTVPHTWGFWWGEKLWVFYLDDKPYMVMPNLAPLDHTAYMKLNIAVGGQGGTPNPINFPAKMPIEWIRVWQ